MPRYVITNPAGLLHTGNHVPETIYVPRKGDPTTADPVSKLEPLFESMRVGDAMKYDAAADAKAMITHPDLVDPEAFHGCSVVPVDA